ncbi:MAG: hypothetical protein KKG06_08225 [Bacteroidetes bacterium]|nr:hypothetical protein [Bacteroidota bacterium]MBU1423150.1 hypothetical protein [Bacteroidota bacterium]
MKFINLSKIFISLTIVFLIASGCQKKFNLNDLPTAAAISFGDTTYIEIVPPWMGFNNPTALLSGFDQLIYIADTDNNRIVQINEAGVVLETATILRPIAIAQDMRLDLLVSGEINRPTIGDTIGAIFRIHLYEADHHLALARIDTIWKETSRPKRRFKGIALLRDNQYLVARDGSDNSSFVDPDSRVLWFNAQTRKDTTKDGSGNIISIKDTVIDKMITPLGDLATRNGSGIVDILRPTDIVTFPNSNDFILTQSWVNGEMIYGALWMVYSKSSDFEGWLPKFNPAKPEERYVDFIKPNRFKEPTAVTIDRSRLDIFIVDSALATIVKFDGRRGTMKSESFGNEKLASMNRPAFKSPKGITFLGKTLYVSDSGNNMIRRFRLSTDR